MSEDWIKMRCNLQTSPQVVRIVSALDADICPHSVRIVSASCPQRMRVVGGLHAVWSLFDTHSVDGKLVGYTLETVDELLQWPGFAAAMQLVDWLEVGTNYLALPRHTEHNGPSAKRRAQEAARKRAVRNVSEVSQDPVRILSASDADVLRTRERERSKRVEAATAPPDPDPLPDPPDSAQPSKRGSRLPLHWRPSASGENFLRTERPDLDFEKTLARFCDYWHAIPGSKGVKIDWEATWRNWVRNERGADGKAGSSPIDRVVQ